MQSGMTLDVKGWHEREARLAASDFAGLVQPNLVRAAFHRDAAEYVRKLEAENGRLREALEACRGSLSGWYGLGSYPNDDPETERVLALADDLLAPEPPRRTGG